jgi:hypothetical protein
VTLFQWQQGRQKSGYEKIRLVSIKWPMAFDAYLLRFKRGSEVPLHTDEVKEGKHHRLNIVLKNAQEGGDFVCEAPIFESKRIKYFRPDISAHRVSRVVIGTRYVFSVGWVRSS